MSLHCVQEHIPFRARPARAGVEVTEGNVTVAVPEQVEAGVGDDVFFNPVQELNRDLTVAVLRAARAGELSGDEDTDNVVLYRENLQSTQGISGNNTVPEQIGIHEVNNSAPGAFLFDNGAKFHSTIHVGELQFGTDPNNAGQAPSIIINVEVDHLAGSDPHNITKNGRTILEDVRENFALYGINIRFRRMLRKATD